MANIKSYIVKLFFLICSLFGFLRVNAQDVVFPEKEWLRSKPEEQGINSAKLDEAMAVVKSICKEQGNSQCVIIRNGYIVWAGDDIDNKHQVWSCSKSFLSTCLGLLWDDGKCSPQDKASKYLPELAKYYPNVTLEQFATFTSGYDSKESIFIPQKPMYAPGQYMHYSDQSEILSLILTHCAGKSLKDFFSERIARPIGLNPADWDWIDYPEKYQGETICGGSGSGEAGISTTAREIARFGWLYANHGNWMGKQLISKRYIGYACDTRVPATVAPYKPKDWYTLLPGAYGLNWWVNGVNNSAKRMWPDAPSDTFAAQGYNNNICFIIPSWKMVIVRLGTDGIIDTNKYNEMFRLIRDSLTNKAPK